MDPQVATQLPGTVPTAVLVVIVYALLEIIKFSISKLTAPPKEEKTEAQAIGLTAEQSRQLQFLYDSHNRHDADGIPLWYVPRSWATTQKEVVEMLKEVAKVQSETLILLEGVAKQVSSHIEKEER